MTRKSKQQKIDVHANEDNPTAEDYESIKQKNINLVQELQQYKVALTEAIEERDQARRELLGERAFTTKILRYIGDIQKLAKSNLNSVIASSNYVSEILKVTNAVHHLTNKEKTIHSETMSATNSPNKTQVVNPMIAGHVILRPIINLQRVNEISSEEIRRLSNPHSIQRNNDNLVNNYSDTNEQPSSPTSTNQSSRNGVIRHDGGGGGDNPILEFKFEEEPRRELDNEFEESNGLGTIIEGAEESGELPSNILELSRPGCSRQPLLSGVFHDVRMYVSSVPEMLDNINTQRGSSTKSLKLTKSPNITSKLSKRLSSNRNKSCVQSNILEENFDLSNDNFNIPGTPVLSSTRLNASGLMMTEPLPSTSFRQDDDSSNSSELRVKKVTFNNDNMVTQRGKCVNKSNNSVRNIETILQSPDSCFNTPDKSNMLNTITQINDLSINTQQALESVQSTPTTSKIETPLMSETADMRVSRRRKVDKTTSENKIDSVPKNRGRPKAKKTLDNKPLVPIKRITRSKYRRPLKYADSVYTGRKSDHTEKCEPKTKESLELINEHSDVSKSQANISNDQANTSKLSNVSKNQSIASNLTNASKSSQSINDASTKNKKTRKRKIPEVKIEPSSSPKKRRAAKMLGSLKEPSLMYKMRR